MERVDVDPFPGLANRDLDGGRRVVVVERAKGCELLSLEERCRVDSAEAGLWQPGGMDGDWQALNVGDLLHHRSNGPDLVVGGAVGLVDPQDHGSAVLGSDVPEFLEVAEGARRRRSPAAP